MAATSLHLDNYFNAIDFTLFCPINQNFISYKNAKGQKGTLICFVCNHCPYVVHIADKLGELSLLFKKNGISIIAVNSNDYKRYPEDSPEKMILFAQKHSWTFPYLYDSDQSTAKAYSAQCTPEFFLFNQEDRLYYHGQFDETRPNSSSVAHGSDLVIAVESLLRGMPKPLNQKPSIGCSIKWTI